MAEIGAQMHVERRAMLSRFFSSLKYFTCHPRGNSRHQRGHPRQSEAIRGGAPSDRQSEAIRGHPRPSEAIRGHPMVSQACMCSPRRHHLGLRWQASPGAEMGTCMHPMAGEPSTLKGHRGYSLRALRAP